MGVGLLANTIKPINMITGSDTPCSVASLIEAMAATPHGFPVPPYAVPSSQGLFVILPFDEKDKDGLYEQLKQVSNGKEDARYVILYEDGDDERDPFHGRHAVAYASWTTEEAFFDPTVRTSPGYAPEEPQVSKHKVEKTWQSEGTLYATLPFVREAARRGAQ